MTLVYVTPHYEQPNHYREANYSRCFDPRAPVIYIHMLVCFMIRIFSICGCVQPMSRSHRFSITRRHFSSYPLSTSLECPCQILNADTLQIVMPHLMLHVALVRIFVSSTAIVIGSVVLCWWPAKFRKNVTREKRKAIL
jgi:hypothetical protein